MHCWYISPEYRLPTTLIPAGLVPKCVRRCMICHEFQKNDKKAQRFSFPVLGKRKYCSKLIKIVIVDCTVTYERDVVRISKVGEFTSTGRSSLLGPADLHVLPTLWIPRSPGNE